MKAHRPLIMFILIFMMSAPVFGASDAPPPGDPGWPRVIQKNGKQLTIYQPQVDYWKDYTDLHFRCAISVKTGTSKKEKFGVAEVDAETVTNQQTRVVALIPKKRDLRFPNTTEAETASLQKVVEELHPFGQALTVSLDRVLAYLDPAEQPVQHAVDLNLEPPRIFYSRKPAILVMFLGEPQLKPVQTDKNDLMFAINTNWDVFFDTSVGRYYLLNQDNWLTTTDVMNGPWTPAGTLPAGLSSLPPDDNWADVRQQVPGKRANTPPTVFVSTEPAELILSKGDPSYSPIPGTKLMRVANTDATLFLNSIDKKYYFLAAGRWFCTTSLDGPWSAASRDLPADFTRIPDNDPAAFVKASVPGTTEAKDAVLLASVPATTVVEVAKPADVQVSYSGQPQFQPIAETTVQYAVNSPNAVLLVNGGYYCCNQGIWFCSGTANGPWTYCTSVPQAIYTIPASSPVHNVTYVTIQNSSPTTVTYSQTAGYSGEYVAATGVLMFGAGMIMGAVIANNYNHYYPPYPMPYSYGSGARYSYAYGGYYRAGQVAYGPYGGAGAAAAYNPNTGTFSRGAYAYGPAGSASVQQAYNPYTGTRATSAQVNTAYGSAGRAAAYNPNTGARAAGAQVNTAYGSASRAAAYNPATGTAARGASKSNAYGSAAAVQTNKGSGAVAWDTANSQGGAVKTKSGNVYAGKDGNVYKKDSSGSWSSNSGSGWETVNQPQPRTASTSSQAASAGSRGQYSTSQSQTGATQQARQPSTASTSTRSSRESTQSLESQAQARQRGNQMSQRTSMERSSSSSSAAGSRTGGGGGGGGRRGR
jgi:hypothetical protein